ncbi:anthranilate synthase component I family protein [Acinetobacter sichuanensis]|uniref:anthranilate synthase component I family protein n=1 Tax=Acinetobacter sichuanensis TaxID=2136183 RepID=UPI00280FC7D1|nr:anthranilate synthase component I family protein [Acinetobacter sichuanensis]MDQ9019508.1 anthranilate synthase component I family protein [Acinetobacter sichuanensis]
MLTQSIFSINLDIQKLTPADILQRLNELFGCVYLEDDHHPVIAFLPQQYLLHQSGHYAYFERTENFKYIEKQKKSNIYEFIKTTPNVSTKQTKIGFSGGYIGFIDYNFSAQQNINNQYKPQPNLFLGQYLSYLKYHQGQWTFYSQEDNPQRILDILKSKLNIYSHPATGFKLNTLCMAKWTKNEYIQAFEKIQNYIKAGDCYQINLTQEFTAKAQGTLIDTAKKFWQLTNAPYSGYLKIDDFELLSCSPELFIEFEDNHKILTKPIKGTMPRYDDPILDEQSKNTLIHSKKDQAENVMIVDLLRNDLSVYAETGSVKTPKLFNIESFNQVHHMVSEITATLKPEVNPFDFLMSALPGGSITGAPKIRAMQIIEELENSPRGAYCGSLGYFNFDGTGSWNILIRSIQKYQDQISVWAGGGITIASDCDAEYQECFDKVSALLDLLNTWYSPENLKEKSES